MNNDNVFYYQGKQYPNYIKDGNHAQYIIPIAKNLCKGEGIDIGAGKPEWSFPGAKICDLNMPPPWNDAMDLPVAPSSQDFVFSSHCLEHIEDYFGALQEWVRALKSGGLIFLYLPSVQCDYWRPANNRKHRHIFCPKDLKYDLNTLNIGSVFYSGVDLSYSFAIYGWKS